MNLLKHIGILARKNLRKQGFDINRFWSLNSILSQQGIEVVFDVGANIGQYGSDLRESGYRGKIISFEPQRQPFAVLAETARGDENWTAVNVGLGREAGQQTINVYSDSVFSSVLPLKQNIYLKDPKLANTETIEIRTLDSLIDQYAKPGEPMFLKIDTQGFEKQVLLGAEQSLSRFTGVQIEMSLTPAYVGQPRLDEMIALLCDKGFVLWHIHRGNCNVQTGQQLEAEGIFIRADDKRKQSTSPQGAVSQN